MGPAEFFFLENIVLENMNSHPNNENLFLSAMDRGLRTSLEARRAERYFGIFKLLNYSVTDPPHRKPRRGRRCSS
jgi:hypothetical protein